MIEIESFTSVIKQYFVLHTSLRVRGFDKTITVTHLLVFFGIFAVAAIMWILSRMCSKFVTTLTQQLHVRVRVSTPLVFVVIHIHFELVLREHRKDSSIFGAIYSYFEVFGFEEMLRQTVFSFTHSSTCAITSRRAVVAGSIIPFGLVTCHSLHTFFLRQDEQGCSYGMFSCVSYHDKYNRKYCR